MDVTWAQPNLTNDALIPKNHYKQEEVVKETETEMKYTSPLHPPPDIHSDFVHFNPATNLTNTVFFIDPVYRF